MKPAQAQPHTLHLAAQSTCNMQAIMAVVSIAGAQVCSYTTQGEDKSQAILHVSIQMHVAHAFQLHMQHC